MQIHFFKEDIKVDLRKFKPYKKWLSIIAAHYQVEIGGINYVFCSDKYLHKINLQYLNHDNLTDIITFDNRETSKEPIEADIFISLERVTDNSKTLHINLDEEIRRVIAHGLLHLIGFKDKTEDDKKKMREAENMAISLKA